MVRSRSNWPIGSAGRPGVRLPAGTRPPSRRLRVHLLRSINSADPGPEARRLSDPDRPEPENQPAGPGMFGVFNLRPGSTTFVPFVIVPRGRPGTIDIAAVGLPRAIEADRLTIRTAPRPRPVRGRRASGTLLPKPTHSGCRLIPPQLPGRDLADRRHGRAAVGRMGGESRGGRDRRRRCGRGCRAPRDPAPDELSAPDPSARDREGGHRQGRVVRVVAVAPGSPRNDS